jgi:hypothetical protein
VPLVEISGWREGIKKISCTRLVQERLGIGLAAAKAYTDQVLDGERVTVAVDPLDAAIQLADDLNALGMVARVLDQAADV